MNELDFDEDSFKNKSSEVSKDPAEHEETRISARPENTPTAFAKDIPIIVPPPQGQSHVFLSDWRGLQRAEILRNLYSAVSLSFISFPFALTMALALNEVAPVPILTYAGSVLSAVVGFLSVVLYSKGPVLFRTFTGVLFPILSDSVELHGKEGLAASSLYIILLLFIGVGFNLFRVVKYVPFFIFEGVKIGTGVLLIFGEVYHLMGIMSHHKEANLIDFFQDLNKHGHKARFGEVFVCLSIGTAVFFIQKKFKQFPWTALIFLAGIIYGYWINSIDPEGKNRVKLLRDLAQEEFSQNKSSFFEYDHDFIPAAFRGLRHPIVFFNSIGLIIMILFEVTISIAINEDYFEKKIKRKQEFMGVACANLVCFFLGILPLSVPIGRVQFALETGGDHKVMSLFSAGIIALMYYLFFTATGFVPICVLKSMNVLISLNLVKLAYLKAFHKYSPHYPWAIAAIVFGMLLLNMAWCIVISGVIFMVVYFIRVKNDPIEFVDRGDGSVEVILQGRFVFNKKKEIIDYIKSKSPRSVILDFSRCITIEVNYARNYKDLITEIEKNVKEVKMVGLERGKLTANLKNLLLKKIPYFKKYLTQTG